MVASAPLADPTTSAKTRGGRSGLLDIGEVADATRLPASTLRYYEERGLIRPQGRRGLRRQYEPEVIERLALIALGRVAGFTLDEIAAVLGPQGEPEINRSLLAAKAGELDRTIRRLTRLRDGLRHAASCPHERHTDCPTFRRLLAAAVRQET